MIPGFDAVMKAVLGSRLAPVLFVLGVAAGVLALAITPREEEPQIVVPMIDVVVEAPGLGAQQTERQVTIPLEKLLAQLPGVEHVYSATAAGSGAVTLRFEVGQDRETALLNTYNKLYANEHLMPAVVSRWRLQPVEVDDVPILVLGLWSRLPQRYSDFELRRVADELSLALQAIPRTNEVAVVAGRPRVVRLELDPEALAARRSTPADILRALSLSNVLREAGHWTVDNRSVLLEGGDVLRRVSDLEALVVNVIDGIPVFLGDVATVVDGPAEPDSYSWIAFAEEGEGEAPPYPMVALSVAKQRGSDAVAVAAEVLAEVERRRADLLPPGIEVSVLRDYGETADAKVNDLVTGLGFAVVTVVVFIGVFLGWRAALVVGLAVPVCYGFTLLLDYAFGYTINRVTLFALILSLGLLVDDPITGIDNISRALERYTGAGIERITAAMREIRIPLLISTLTIVVAFVPLAFITGMMGPYMAPMAFNVPVAVILSTVTAFLVTPWLGYRLLRPGETGSGVESVQPEHPYRRLLEPILRSRPRIGLALGATALLFLLVLLLPVFRLVPLKLLPFDNRTEVQVLIDLPEGSTLEETAALTRRVAREVLRLPEVEAAAAFIGVPSPMDFNGMVRRYYRRQAPELGELRLVLAPKAARVHQSHAVVLRLRELLQPLQGDGRVLRVVEVPPGPPVLATVVGEVYADPLVPFATQARAAQVLMHRLAREPHVVEVDSSLEAPRPRARFVVDKTKAALSGIATSDVAELLALVNGGEVAGYLHLPRELQPLPVELRLAQGERAAEGDFEKLLVRGRPGFSRSATPSGLEPSPQPLVALGELGAFRHDSADLTRHRKDLRRVVYVTAELDGRTPGAVIADVVADRGLAPGPAGGEPRRLSERSFVAPGGGIGWELPAGTRVSWTGEGELKITLDVFRDMGLGYLFALLGIFVLLRIQTGSMALSLIIMSAIPLTVIGILPGFWLMNLVGERTVAGAPDPVLFTATAMIGMIALAGIVVRNSLILVEFVDQARHQGAGLREALLQAGSVRMRPVLLTAGTTLLGNLVITLDPVFNGLALAIIFGIVASTLFTLLVVPLVYLLVFERSAEAATAPLEDS